MSGINDPSLVWSANPADPNASTSLTVDDLVAGGGALAMRSHIVNRLGVAEASEPGSAKAWSQLAIDHMVECAADVTDGGVEVSAAALQMVLAYLAWLEARGAA